MRIQMGGGEKRDFCIVLPLRLLATRVGSLMAAAAANRRLAGGEDITARQMRCLGRALQQSAAVLRTAGLPLLEMRDQDGEWVKIEL